MNKTELAKLLDGIDFNKARGRIPQDLIEQAKQNNLVIVHGASDDLMELCGGMSDEFGCFDGGTAYITPEGLLEIDDDCCKCKYLKAAKDKARKIKAVWNDCGDPVWTYETDIPHETFDIYEGDEKYCRGIVFSLEDLK